MAKSTEVAVKNDAALPAHLQGGKKVRVGNIDQSDLIIPRIKLLQAVSPEVTDFENAKAGQFWHTVASEVIGAEFRIVPVLIRKSYVLWAPRGDERGVLARANDAKTWDVRDTFEVKPKGSAKKVTWDTTEGTVAGSGLDKFGSSIPDDDNSAPAAALTYNMLVHLPDHPEFKLAIMLLTRSAVKPARDLISKIDMRPVDHYGQVFKVSATKQEKDGETFLNYKFVADGYADAESYELAKAMYERYNEADFRANDENEEDAQAGGGSAQGNGKF